MIEIQTITSSKDWKRFVDLPWSLYRGNPYWVPPLRIAVRDVLSVKKNPFFRHAKLLPLIAIRDREVVGRIVGVVDQAYNAFHQEQTGFFGFFESIDDKEVSDSLLDQVTEWARAQGMERVLGPVNPSTNHECGLLIEGFDKSPRIMMTYNPPYYAKLIEDYGLVKAKDLQAWDVDSNNSFTQRLIKIADRQRKRSKITVREVNMKSFDQEVDIMLDIYNSAWEKNWGFVPMDEVEFRHMAKEMKMIIDPRLLLIVYVEGEPAAFGLTLPNINQVFHKIGDGRLLPFGIFKLLWHYFGPGRQSTVTETRILALGIKPKFRNLGLGSLLYVEYVKRSPATGAPVGEASWILEDNKDMIASLKSMNAILTRRYRIYQKSIVSA